MTTETRPRKGTRFTNEQMQAKLSQLFVIACAEEKVAYAKDTNSIIIRCPLEQCNACLDDSNAEVSILSKRICPKFSLVVADVDEESSLPRTFSPNEGRRKLIKHLGTAHKRWYRSGCDLLGDE